MFTIVYLLGILFSTLAIFMPWWGFHSSVEVSEETSQMAYLDIGIGPTGIFINTAVGDLSSALGPIKEISIVVMLPVTIPLVIGLIDGLYCGLTRTISRRSFAPALWMLGSLFNWFFYWGVVYVTLSSLGLDIPPVGSYTLEFKGYTLVGASWGWGIGMYSAIIALILFMAGASLLRKEKLPYISTYKRKYHHSVYSVFVLVIAVLSLLGVLGIILLSNILFGFSWVFVFLIMGVVNLFLISSIAKKEYILCPQCNREIEIKNYKSNYVCQQCGWNFESKRASEVKKCPECGNPVVYVPQYGQYYCQQCQKYVNFLEESVESKEQESSADVQKSEAKIPSTSTMQSYCPYCGNVLPSSEIAFCPYCGKKLKE